MPRTPQDIPFLSSLIQREIIYRIFQIGEGARLRAIATLGDQSHMSPFQYQRRLRLLAARGRMLIDGMDATSAAFDVGYESASQFNREYSRFFGQPPMRDIQTLRSPGAPLLEAVSIR